MKKSLFLIIALAFTAYFVWIFSYTMDPKLDLNGDNAIYISLARNIADGGGYGSTSLDGTYTPASHFPPGYSTILGAAISLGIDTLLGFKILNGIFLLLSLGGLIYIAARTTRQLYLVIGAAALSLLCPTLMHFAGIVMSEMSYMLFTVVALVALYQYSAATPQGKQMWAFLRSPWFYVAIVAAVGSYHIRTVGASIMAAIVIFFLFRKEWIATAGSVVGMILLMIPWMVRNKIYDIHGRYLDTVMVVNPWRPEEGNISSVGEFFSKTISNLDETVIKGFKEILFPFIEVNYQQPSSFLAVVGGLIIVGIIFWGAWQMGKMRWTVMAFIAGNMGLFALWHGGNGARYVTPIAPILFICFYLGIYALIQLALKNRIKDHAPYLAVVLLMALPMIAPIRQQHDIATRPYPIQYQQYFAIAEELNKRAPEHSVVCCRKPELFKYYAPRLNTARYIYSEDAKALVDNLVKQKVDYVVLEQLGYSSTPRYLVPAIEQYNQYFPIVWHLENPDAYLLRFDRVIYEQQNHIQK